MAGRPERTTSLIPASHTMNPQTKRVTSPPTPYRATLSPSATYFEKDRERIHRPFRRPVSQEMTIAVRNDDDVAGSQLFARSVRQPRVSSSLDEKVDHDQTVGTAGRRGRILQQWQPPLPADRVFGMPCSPRDGLVEVLAGCLHPAPARFFPARCAARFPGGSASTFSVSRLLNLFVFGLPGCSATRRRLYREAPL